jgi:hypothetical protein
VLRLRGINGGLQVGDVIIVVGGGDTKGTVKAIGFRHTEINHPDGERLVVANKVWPRRKLASRSFVEPPSNWKRWGEIKERDSTVSCP